MRVAAAAKEKKALKVVILDVRAVASFCDYFVIAGASSLRQTNAVAQGIVDDLDQVDIKPLSPLRSEDESGWIALDFSSVVVHVFHEPLREFYALEHLWSDAKRVRFTLPRAAK